MPELLGDLPLRRESREVGGVGGLATRERVDVDTRGERGEVHHQYFNADHLHQGRSTRTRCLRYLDVSYCKCPHNCLTSRCKSCIPELLGHLPLLRESREVGDVGGLATRERVDVNTRGERGEVRYTTNTSTPITYTTARARERSHCGRATFAK